MLTGRNIMFGVLAIMALAFGMAAFLVYDNVTTPDDNAFALRVAAENMAIQLEQGCQYDAAARANALGASSGTTVASPVQPSAGAAVPAPIATSIAVNRSGAGSNVNVGLVSSTGRASIATPCRADAIPQGSTVP